MSKSQNSFIKNQKEKLKQKKRKDKAEKKKERQDNSKGGALEDMMAWVDENGNLVNTPPAPKKPESK
jgi:hypothetical protein